MATVPDSIWDIPRSPTPGDVEAVPVRRSGRVKKEPPKKKEKASDASVPHERPKRKAAAAAAAARNIVSDDVNSLIEETLGQIEPDECREYDGWVELESEPAFFESMLLQLGAKDFTVDEVLQLDSDYLDILPQPIHGLIFLFEYEGSDDDEDEYNRQDCPDHLWFANQTVSNACATFALMNIVMNAQGVSLGDQLQEFKDSTKDLLPPHRGHFLETNDAIRSTHNSVARRVDLLAEDLSLDNKREESLAKKKKKKQKKAQKPSRTTVKKVTADLNFHYIAFVPVSGQLWELDGMYKKPLCLGPITPNSWLETACPIILNRMAKMSEQYNLLAVCQSPLKALSSELGTNYACGRYLHEAGHMIPTWGVPDPLKDVSDAQLAEYNLTRAAINALHPPPDFLKQVMREDFDAHAARKLASELENRRLFLITQHANGLDKANLAVDVIRGRQRDFTPAVHRWARVLAEKGMLRQMIRDMD